MLWVTTLSVINCRGDIFHIVLITVAVQFSISLFIFITQCPVIVALSPCSVGGDSPSEPANAARGHAGQTPPEDHKVPPPAQGCAEIHPGPSCTARTQRHGEMVKTFQIMY